MAVVEASDRDFYMLNREFRESARKRVNCSFSPDINFYDDGSNYGLFYRCWLLELAREVPASWTLEGFDISAAQYPAVEYLPSNVSLKTLDVYAKTSEDLIGRFDIVHIRAFTVVVRGEDTASLLKNVIAMLKPGGYLQWDEVDAGSFHPETPRASISTQCTDELLREWKNSCAKAGMGFVWISSLDDSFTSQGLEVVDSFRIAHRNDLKKAFSDNWLTALEEAGVSFTSRGGGSGPFATADGFRELFKNVVKETREGAGIALDLIVVLGKKRA
ncbi:MAG: hypothetical protein Q9187_005171 [Circinaria calcarea]